MLMFDIPDLATLLVWLFPVVMAGVLVWDWYADWYEEFRQEDDEWWESLTDEDKAALQRQVDSQGKRLDEHEKKINELDETAIRVNPKNDTQRNQSSSK